MSARSKQLSSAVCTVSPRRLFSPALVAPDPMEMSARSKQDLGGSLALRRLSDSVASLHKVVLALQQQQEPGPTMKTEPKPVHNGRRSRQNHITVADPKESVAGAVSEPYPMMAALQNVPLSIASMCK